MKLQRVFTELGLNAIPAAGWFLGQWSPGTMLAVYWFETLAASLLVGLRVVIHRRLSPRRGHFEYTPQYRKRPKDFSTGSYLAAFLPTSIAFSVVHGVFLGLILGLIF